MRCSKAGARRFRRRLKAWQYGKRGAPCPPVAARVVVDAALLIKAWHAAEQINGYEFLVRQKGVEVTLSLIL
jgi:hypothetical protein